MRISLFLILSFGLLVLSCKKDNPKPLTPQPTNYLRHSGTLGSETFTLNTSTISPKWIETQELDYMDYKTFRIRTWLKGAYLQDSLSGGEDRLTMDLYFRIPYDASEYDTSCNCLPALNVTQLANHINDPSFEWNDLSTDHKNILMLYWNGQFVGGPYNAINTQIHAQADGNTIRIHGTVDSVEILPNGYIKNLQIDYLIPLHP